MSAARITVATGNAKPAPPSNQSGGLGKPFKGHLPYIISHFSFVIDVEVEGSYREPMPASPAGTSCPSLPMRHSILTECLQPWTSMTNEKCEMIYGKCSLLFV
jgi:hypothetical protein